ncbi:ABC transporter ATP-binding protein [Devosia sp.]|uniref:ABC transporter ATP-binding protein n=1 Tax=Devosia sp. TaxID=1871048 RepID=UPI002EDDA297
MITVSHLEKVYHTRDRRRVHALKDVTFSIAPSEFISIVGPSGCGKSTLLKILAGLIKADGGTFGIAGPSPSRDRSGSEVGFVFQSPVLLPWRTILENVLFPSEVFGTDKRQARSKALELLSMVQLEGFEDRYPHELSGGMQQRAAIVRALVHEPSILMMDEPFGALDAMTREAMNLEILRIWRATQKTVLFVTHSITEAVFLADRVLVMTPRPGTLAEIIPIDLPRPRGLEIINSPQFGTYATHIRGLLNAHGDLS